MLVIIINRLFQLKFGLCSLMRNDQFIKYDYNQSKHDYSQFKPIKIMSVSNRVDESRQILPTLLFLLPPFSSPSSLFISMIFPHFSQSFLFLDLSVLFFLHSLLSIVSLFVLPHSLKLFISNHLVSPPLLSLFLSLSLYVFFSILD